MTKVTGGITVTLAALLGVMAGCVTDEPTVGTERSNDAIVGGTAATAGQFPTIAALKLSLPGGGTGLCTATLIRPNVLLTARHCTDGLAPNQITAVFDQLDAFGSGGVTVAIAEKLEHAGWNASNLPGGQDLSLLRLATPLTDRTPTDINLDATFSGAGTSVTMAGYGRRNPNLPNDSGLLYVLSNKIIRACNTFGLSNEAGLLCYSQAAPEASGKCNGDSGGPSFATVGGVQKLVGVTSFGDQTCTQYGVDIQVDAEAAFLQAGLDAWAPAQSGDPSSQAPPSGEDAGQFADGGAATGGCATSPTYPPMLTSVVALVMLRARRPRRRA